MSNDNFEILDVLTIISFALQLQNTTELSKQATNNDVIHDIHQDIERLESKLDSVIARLDLLLDNPDHKS